MTQWKQIQQLEMRLLEHVDYLYDDNFPMDIRQSLAGWIESQDWDSAVNDESMASVLFTNLLSQLENVRMQEQNFLQRHNMKIIHQQLQRKYTSNTTAMARVISTCLREERRILSSVSTQEQGALEQSLQNSVAFKRQKSMDNRVGIIRGSVQLVDQAVKYIEDMQDDFDFCYKTLQSREASDRSSERMKQEVTRLQEMLNRLDFKRKEVLSKMDVVIKEVDDLVTSQLSPELQDWKRRQQIAGIGGPMLTGLEQLQSWFTVTAQSLFQMKRQLDKLGELVVKVTYESDPIPLQKPHLEERVKYLIYHLIKSSFVVEKQPCMPTHPQKPLIIKTGVQFTTKVRLLVKLPEVDYQLKVKTTFDKDLPPGRVRQFFILTNNTKVMDIEDYSNGCLSVEFRHLQLKEKKYINGTKGNEGLLSVTEELHSLSFEACFTVQGLTVDLETCSLPLVVISNVSQLPGGWASVMWYNLLTDEPRNLAFFGNPPRASWTQLSEVLSWQFSTFAGQGLNKDQLSMLGEKLLGQLASCSDCQVSWSKFAKENIPGKPFSFWMWLDSILELIKKHLLPVWNENYIMGFVSKEMERVLLKDREPGTFLLRFSESHLGGITFTWVEHSENGEVKFNSVEPYTKNRLSALPFADIIRDYKVISDGVVPENPLKFLYPDIPKDEAFGRLYNSQPSKVHPYIPSTLIPISEMRSNSSSTPRSCQSPEPPMTPGEFDMLSEHLCIDIDTMAQWQDLLKLDSALQSRVQQLYEGRFPREIRHFACSWIESQDWLSAAESETAARTCFQALLDYLEELWNRSVQENNILEGPDFRRMMDYLMEHFQGQPVNLALIMSDCLNEEKKILSSVTTAQNNLGMPLKWREVNNKVTGLKWQISELKKEIKTLDGLNEKLDFFQQTWQSKVEQNIQVAESKVQMVEGECLKRANIITRTKQIVVQRLVNLLNQTAQTVATLTDVELPEWKYRQQLSCIGGPMDTSLGLLQKWFTAIAEVLFGVREQLQNLQDQNNKYSSSEPSKLSASVAELNKFVLSLITKLLTNSLVVEKQPIMLNLPHRPLILKTMVRFKVTVRFLANLPVFNGLLKVKPVFDKDVEEAKTVSGFRLFDFTSDNSKVLDVDTPDGGLMAQFEHMSIKEKKARKKGLSESHLGVTEELHVIRFVTTLTHAGQTFNIEASSLPVVVISSSNQVPSAWASIMWWNMLCTSASMDLSLFAAPPPVAWQQLSQILSWQFLSVGQRNLDEHQLSELRDKFVDDPEGLVTWSKFTKDESTWIWVDGILDLINKYLSDLWQDGSIMGFVGRERTKFLLQTKATGTFLIRFSESIRDGAVTFSWVDHSSGEAHVHAVQPYTKKELSVLSLPDAINHYTLTAQGYSSYNPLMYLYPDIPKDTAFGRYYKVPGPSATNQNCREYLHRRLTVVSNHPTPPPSPPMEAPRMDVDTNVDQSNDPNQRMDEFFQDLLDLPESDIFWPSFQLSPPSLQDILESSAPTCQNGMDH
ncbi:signal transducer and activator of transcription 4 isoform X2 [Nothobranchius furzeri]|uniref:signal transducer and activator of transcription 4 isoform X2 n=1 Tax=Nothobranchius furzeri TaxID=105023 RepID=UPI003904DE46